MGSSSRAPETIDVCSSDEEDTSASPPNHSAATASANNSMNATLAELRKAREARESKRPRESSAAAAQPRKTQTTSTRKFAFVLAPAAGGQIPTTGGLADVLRQAVPAGTVDASVAAVDAPSWGVRGTPNSNAAKVEALVDSIPAGAIVVLVGHSYGNRVLVEFIRKHMTSAGQCGAAARRGALLLGYPLHATRGNTDRVTPLQTLPADAPPLTFVSGRRDEFIKKSEEVLRRAIAGMACRANVTIAFTDGGHGVHDGTSAALEAVRAHLARM